MDHLGEPELIAAARRLFNMPDTHPTTRLAAAAHEAAHAAAAVGVGIVPQSIVVGEGDGTAGHLSVTLPERFAPRALLRRLRSTNPEARGQALADVRSLCCVYLASLVFYEAHGLEERWACIEDFGRASRLFARQTSDDDEHADLMEEARASLRRFFRRPEVENATNAVTAEVLEHGEVLQDVIMWHCGNITPGSL